MQRAANNSSSPNCYLTYYRSLGVLTIIWLFLFFLLIPSSLAAHGRFCPDSGRIEGESADYRNVPTKNLEPSAAGVGLRRGLCLGHLLLGLAGLLAFSWMDDTKKETPPAQQHSRWTLDDADYKFRLLVEQSLAGIYIIQNDKFLYVNPKFAEIFGYTPEEILALPSMYILVDEPDRPLMASNIHKRLAGEVDSVNYTFRSRRRDGTIIYVEVHGTVARINQSPVVMGTLLDITPTVVAQELLQKAHDELDQRVNERTAELVRVEEDLRKANEELEERVALRTFELMQANEYLRRQIKERQQTEEALRFSEQKYRNIFENAQAGIFRTRWHDGKVLESNYRLAQIFGYQSREDFINNHKSSVHYVDPEVRPKVLAVLAKGETCNFEAQMRQEDGTLIWIACSARLFPEKGYIEGVINDITDRKRAEENLENIQRQQKAILDNIPDIAWLKDQDSRYIAVNEAFAQACGVKPEDLVGQSDLEIFPRELAQRYRADDRTVIESGKRKRVEEPFADKEGRMTWIETIKSPIYNEQGEVRGTAGIARDMTERKQHEAERMRLAAAIEQADEGVIMADPEGRIIYVNPAVKRIRGYGREELLGQHVNFLINGATKETLSREIWETISQGHSYRGHATCYKKDGAAIESNLSISPVRDEFGNIINYVIVEHDMTGEIRLAGQLRQAQKMEAIGTLAGGIAHDFNNILSPIITNTEIALDDLPPESPIRDNLERVLRASERAADLVRQILSIGRRQKYARQPTQLDSLLAETVKFMRASLPATIDINFKRNKPIWLVEVDPGQIQQVLLNLLINAAQAMSAKGGVLGIYLENLDIAGEVNDQGISIPAGAYLRLSVSDTGSGMEPEILERIFEPYFTTKPTGKGTGLGLAVALSIIKAHDGFIAVESRPGAGTTFRLYLPRSEETPRVSATGAAPTLPGSESILLVDDEEEIVLALTQGLQSLGYQVKGFTSSLAALEGFQERPDRFDLIVTDQTMPGMSGEELSRAVLTIRPQMPIILCTGLGEIMTSERAKSLGIRELLIKPLSHYSLAEAIRRHVAPGPLFA